MSEANVNTNKTGVSTKWNYHKEGSFARNYFIFLKVLLQFKNPFKHLRVNLMYQLPNCPCSYFSYAHEFYLTVLFPCEYP